MYRAYIVPEIGQVMQNHVILIFKVVRQGHAFGSSWNELLDP